LILRVDCAQDARRRRVIRGNEHSTDCVPEGLAPNRANMIRAIATIPLAPRFSSAVSDAPASPSSSAPLIAVPYVVTKTLFVAPAASDGAIIALVLCDDRAFRVTRNGEPVLDAEPDLDRAIHCFRKTVRKS